MSSLSLRSRAALLALVGVTVVAVIAGLVWTAFSSVNRTAADVSQRLSPAMASASDLSDAYDEIDKQSRTYVLTANAEAHRAYQDAVARSERDYAEVWRDLQGFPDLLVALSNVDTAVAPWLDGVVVPTVALREKRGLTAAETAEFLATSTLTYAPVTDAMAGLSAQISQSRDAASETLSTLARRLAVALAGAGVVLTLGILAAYLLVRRWVLTPLDRLRQQVRAVADGDRQRVISPSGPPELYAAGADAEAMRRALVHEQDAARAAGEGLAQEGPVVAALRADLATDPDPSAHLLEIHGRIHAAHGVLAGDWWGVVSLEGNRTALMVIDVSGHGELAGLVTQRLRSVLTVSLRSGFDPATVLRRGATLFSDQRDGRFATALVVVLDPDSGALTWANAGHPTGWLLAEGDPAQRTELSPTGPLLSALGGEWDARACTLGEGDLMLAWSDGLVEAPGTGAEISQAALERAVGRALEPPEGRGPVPVGDLVESVLADLRQDAADWRRDDVTLVAVRRRS